MHRHKFKQKESLNKKKKKKKDKNKNFWMPLILFQNFRFPAFTGIHACVKSGQVDNNPNPIFNLKVLYLTLKLILFLYV